MKPPNIWAGLWATVGGKKKLPVVKTILEAVEEYSPFQVQNWMQL